MVMLVGVWSSFDGDDDDDGMVLWQGCNGVVGGGVLLLVVWCGVAVVLVMVLWRCDVVVLLCCNTHITIL